MTAISHQATSTPKGRPLVLQLGHEELVVRQRCETASIVNDLLIGPWSAPSGAPTWVDSIWTFLGSETVVTTADRRRAP